MTKLFLFLLGFSLGFTIDVTVEAAERVQLKSIDPAFERTSLHSSALLEQPRNCLLSRETCAVRIGDRRKLIIEPTKGREWTLSEKTIVVRLSSERLRFIEGSLKVTGLSTTIETEQGELTVQGEAFIDRHGSVLTVVNTGSEVLTFRGRGWTTAHEIPAGLETSIDLPNVKSGQTAINLPLPFDFDAQVVREARVFTGPKDGFPKRLEYLAELRSSAAAESAALHREVVERKIASIAVKEASVREARAKRETRDRELRALFRRKVLNPE